MQKVLNKIYGRHVTDFKLRYIYTTNYSPILFANSFWSLGTDKPAYNLNQK